MAPLQYVEVELTPKDGLGRQHGLTPKWAQSPVVRRFAWTGSMILCWWVAGDLAKPLNFGTFRGWLSCMQQDRRCLGIAASRQHASRSWALSQVAASLLPAAAGGRA